FMVTYKLMYDHEWITSRASFSLEERSKKNSKQDLRKEYEN
ncbi:8745_t:CDS:1, partial [Funneliformis caledonium]